MDIEDFDLAFICVDLKCKPGDTICSPNAWLYDTPRQNPRLFTKEWFSRKPRTKKWMRVRACCPPLWVVVGEPLSEKAIERIVAFAAERVKVMDGLKCPEHEALLFENDNPPPPLPPCVSQKEQECVKAAMAVQALCNPPSPEVTVVPDPHPYTPDRSDFVTIL